jgi:hypothetical protein
MNGMWIDFETWLYKNYNLTLPDLSWNAYVERSKEYNTARLSKSNIDLNTTKSRHGLERE